MQVRTFALLETQVEAGFLSLTTLRVLTQEATESSVTFELGVEGVLGTNGSGKVLPGKEGQLERHDHDLGGGSRW